MDLELRVIFIHDSNNTFLKLDSYIQTMLENKLLALTSSNE